MSKEKFVVRAYDTDYGFDTTWEFDSQKAAEEWVNVLLYDYGNECQAHWYRKEAK